MYMRNIDLEWEDDLLDDDFYSEEFRENMVDNDELSPSEAGFMEGHDSA